MVGWVSPVWWMFCSAELYVFTYPSLPCCGKIGGGNSMYFVCDKQSSFPLLLMSASLWFCYSVWKTAVSFRNPILNFLLIKALQIIFFFLSRRFLSGEDLNWSFHTETLSLRCCVLCKDSTYLICPNSKVLINLLMFFFHSGGRCIVIKYFPFVAANTLYLHSVFSWPLNVLICKHMFYVRIVFPVSFFMFWLLNC